MKKALQLVGLVVAFFITCSVNATSVEDLKLYNSLQKKRSALERYDGYMFNALLNNKVPDVSVFFTDFSRKRDADDRGRNTLINLLYGISNQSGDEFQKQFNIQKSKTIKSFAKVGELKIGSRDVIRFDFFDDTNNLIYSEYKDEITGFGNQKVYYDSKGGILFVEFFYHLKFNEGQSVPVDRGQKTISIKKYIRSSDDFSSIDGIRDFSIRVFKDNFSLQLDDF